MPNVYTKHAGSVKAVENYLGPNCPNFTWAGKAPIPILPGSALRRKDLGQGGFKLVSDLIFVVVVADLPVPGPDLKQMISYLGANYRIDSIRTLCGGTLQRFECNDPNQPA